jgi:hypothetical protein
MDLHFQFPTAVPFQTDALLGRTPAEETVTLREPQKGAVDGESFAIVDVEIEEAGEGVRVLDCHAEALDRLGCPTHDKEGQGPEGVDAAMALGHLRQGLDKARPGPAEKPVRTGRVFVRPGKIEGQGDDRAMILPQGLAEQLMPGVAGRQQASP